MTVWGPREAKDTKKLLTYIRSDNPAALSAYLSQDFRIVGTAERQVKLRGVYVDAVIVERLL